MATNPLQQQLSLRHNVPATVYVLHFEQPRLPAAQPARRRRRRDGARQPLGPRLVAIWAGVGEWVAEHLAKGDKVVLAGRLKWSEGDATDGKRQAIEIHADSIVPITHRDAWKTHHDHGANTNPVGDEDIPF